MLKQQQLIWTSTTDGTDNKFKGAILSAVDDGAKKAFFPAANNDVITMNGAGD